MNDLLDLFEKPRVRKNDPETSRQAAKKVKVQSIRHAILERVNQAGYQGLASFEIAERLKVPRDYISPHLKPLEHLGYVERTKMTRANRKTASKVSSIVWVTTSLYRESLLANVVVTKDFSQIKCCPNCGYEII